MESQQKWHQILIPSLLLPLSWTSGVSGLYGILMDLVSLLVYLEGEHPAKCLLVFNYQKLLLLSFSFSCSSGMLAFFSAQDCCMSTDTFVLARAETLSLLLGLTSATCNCHPYQHVSFINTCHPHLCLQLCLLAYAGRDSSCFLTSLYNRTL